MLHPISERLQTLADGSLAPEERAVMESHLLGCARCQAELEEWRSLFASLSGLVRFEPATGFVERVMSGVRTRQPWMVRAAAMLARLLPGTTGGWAVAVAVLALPTLAVAGGVTWLLTRPWMSTQAVLVFARDGLGSGVTQAGAWTWARLLESPLAVWITELVLRGDLRSVGAAAALFATMLVGSLWILYRNVVRTQSQEATYVSLCF